MYLFSSPGKIKVFTRLFSVTTEERTLLCLTFQAKVNVYDSEEVPCMVYCLYINHNVFDIIYLFHSQSLMTSSMPLPTLLVGGISWIFSCFKPNFFVPFKQFVFFNHKAIITTLTPKKLGCYVQCQLKLNTMIYKFYKPMFYLWNIVK